MMQSNMNDESIKNCLASAKTIAMVGVSSVKKENSSVKVAPPNSQPTPGVVTASKSEVE